MKSKNHRSNESDTCGAQTPQWAKFFKKNVPGPCPKGMPTSSLGRARLSTLFETPQNSSHNLEIIDIKTFIQKNAFIESYYPTIQLDSSETTRSRSSCEGTPMQIYCSTKDKETESGFGGDLTQEETTNACFGSSSFFQQESSFTKSNSSTDTKTYTLFCSSDVESTRVNTSQPISTKLYVKNYSKDGQQLENGDKVAECFAQLYNRIYNLEDLLHHTLKKSLSAEDHKCFEMIVGEMAKPKTMKPKGLNVKPRKPNPGKAKTKMGLSAGKTKAWESTCLSIAEGTDEKENSDTDNELKRIKNRLKVLEDKLKKTQNLPLHRNHQEPLTSSSLVFAGTDGSCSARCRIIPKDTDTTAPVCSDIESIRKNEVMLSNVASSSEEEFGKKKVKFKEVRKKIISKCRNIKKKCGSSVNSSKKSPLKMPTASGWKEILYQHSVVTEESVATTLLSRSFSASTQTDSSTVFFLKCQNDGPLQPLSKFKRKERKKRKHLSKTNSKTNIFSTHSTKSPKSKFFIGPQSNPVALNFGNRDLSRTSTLQICDRSSKLCPSAGDNPLCRDVATELTDLNAFWMPPQDKICSRSSDQNQKSLKKRLSFRNPLDILKRGRKIKIPVLFQELCKTSNKKKLEQELSNVSMRFVIVEEDNTNPLSPFRRLIKKLSQTKPIVEPEQFMFGVFKCQCDCQVQKLNSLFESNVTKEST